MFSTSLCDPGTCGGLGRRQPSWSAIRITMFANSGEDKSWKVKVTPTKAGRIFQTSFVQVLTKHFKNALLKDSPGPKPSVLSQDIPLNCGNCRRTLHGRAPGPFIFLLFSGKKSAMGSSCALVCAIAFAARLRAPPSLLSVPCVSVCGKEEEGAKGGGGASSVAWLAWLLLSRSS